MRVSPSWSFWIALLGCYAGTLIWGPLNRIPPIMAGAGEISVPGGLRSRLFTGLLAQLSLLKEYASQADGFWEDVRTHLFLSGIAVLVGTILGTMIGWGAHRLERYPAAAFFFLNLVQTLPSLALFGLLIVPLAALGLGGYRSHSGVGRLGALRRVSHCAVHFDGPLTISIRP